MGHLADFVFSWSLEDIFNENLYKDKIEKIPETFDSVERYFGSFVDPLLEETRAELCSCMDIDAISTAQFAEVFCFEECKPYGTGLYDCKVNGWKNKSKQIGKEPYKLLPGDVFLLADIKPEVASDLQRVGKSWSLAIVHKILEDDENEDENDLTSTSFKVKVSVDNLEMIEKLTFVVFLFNIVPSRRIWNALHMDINSKIIRKLLCPRSMVDIEDHDMSSLLNNKSKKNKKTKGRKN